MKAGDSYKRNSFLAEHPPITKRVVLASSGTEQTLLAGSVIGKEAESFGIFSAKDGQSPFGILVEDVTIPASGDAFTSLYIHAHVVRNELVFADGMSAEAEENAVTELRKIGIFAV